MFNFCIVIETDVDEIPYEAVVRRLAKTFTEMETQNHFLSQEDVSNDRDRRSIESLLEIIKEDLNNYQECMIPVGKSINPPPSQALALLDALISSLCSQLTSSTDDANTINMKLFPHHPVPAPIKPWHVPITKISFEPIMDDTWDLTMKLIIPLIDGISDVRRLSIRADVALDLTIIALRHLLYYDSIIILDLFLFGNIYACTPEINDFVADNDGMQKECADYVFINGHRMSNFWLVRLYTSLSTSRTLKEWIKMHLENGLPVLDVLDVRRFIQFGIIKGFLYRVHKYIVSAKYLKSLVTGQNVVVEGAQEYLKYVDGMSTFDRIYLEEEVDDKMLMEKLKKFPKGDLEAFYR